MTVVRALTNSLTVRFGGLLNRIKILDDDTYTGFGDIIYPMASLLDPAYGFIWLEVDLPCTDEVKQELDNELREEIIREAEALCKRENTSKCSKQYISCEANMHFD